MYISSLKDVNHHYRLISYREIARVCLLLLNIDLVSIYTLLPAVCNQQQASQI